MLILAIQGLRGVASVVIVCGHLCTAFVPHLHAPANGDGERPETFQLPILRLCVGGRAAVATFFMITGYVNAVRPIARARAGNADAALSSISRSCLTRPARLILPTIVATLFSWVLANIDAYSMAKSIDSTWIRQGWHAPATNMRDALTTLGRACVETWTRGWNEYDGTQWTMVVLLEGGMMVHLTTLATVKIMPRARMAVLFAIYLYSWGVVGGAGMTQKSRGLQKGQKDKKNFHLTKHAHLFNRHGSRRNQRPQHRNRHGNRRITRQARHQRNIPPPQPLTAPPHSDRRIPRRISTGLTRAHNMVEHNDAPHASRDTSRCRHPTILGPHRRDARTGRDILQQRRA